MIIFRKLGYCGSDKRIARSHGKEAKNQEQTKER